MKHAVIGILAPVDAGKTTLNEALLFHAGAVRNLGSVDEKSSHLDFHALEQRRGITIYSKQALVRHGEVELTLVDTPGHVDFSAEAERTLRVLDYAILIVDANDEIRGHAETLWRLLERYEIPTFVFVNKTDLSKLPHAEQMELVRDRLSASCIDFSGTQTTDWLAKCVDGECSGDGRGADGLASCRPKGGSAEGAPAEIAEPCAAEDEDALDEFIESGTLTLNSLQQLVENRSVFPCFFGSALRQIGIDELVGGVAALVSARSYPDEFAARVYKITHDSSGTRLTWLKVTGGSLSAKQVVEGADSKGAWSEKVDQIRLYSGARFETTARVEAGRICAVAGLSRTQAGMLLGRTGYVETDAKSPSSPILAPVMASSVVLNGNDVHAVHAALNLLTDEDPLLDARWNERLQELQVRIMGEIQLEVLQATLRERFNLDVDFAPGGILYRETIAEPVTGIGHFEPLRHYAEVHLRLEPLPSGTGVKFGTCCHVDELDLNWQRLILTNAMEREHLGVLVGAPLADVRITLIGGRAHNKHTEGGDFRQATYRAIRQALMQAQSVLLEPWYRFSIRVPSEHIGRALADVQRMSGKPDAPTTDGRFSLVEGTAPAKEIKDYAMQLSAYTHGTGSLTLEFIGYEPCHDADEVIGQAAYDPTADLAHTPDSVFCSHGAGHTVKWNEVAAHAHVHPDPSTFTAWREANSEFFRRG